MKYILKSKHNLISWRTLMLLVFCVSSISMYAQKTVSGTVTDSDGFPLVGVNITEKGTTNGVITDVDGNYTISLKKTDSKLVFSYVGFSSKEIKVLDQTHINVSLEQSSTLLDEVVAVGYATQKKATVASAVSSINTDDLARSASTSVANALVGKVSGLTFRQKSGQPGSATSIQVRNMGEPLYVIDGIMKDASAFNSLDVNDIANISILKDGAAAIYGVKAANGVVLVTTKTGKRGEKAKVSINANVGWSGWTEYPDLLNASQWKYANYMKSVNSGNLKGTDAINAAKNDLEKWQQGYYNPETGEDYRGFNWKDEFVRDNAPQYYINANVQGGSDKMDYYLSLSHVDQDAVFREYTYNRTNLQGNFNMNLTNDLKLGFSVLGKVEQNINPALPGDDDYFEMRNSIYNLIPTMRPYANDNPDYLNFINPTHDKAHNMAAYTIDNAGKYQKDVRTIQTSANLEYNIPIDGLTAKAQLSYFYYDLNEENNEKSWNEYTYDPATKEYKVAYTKSDTYLGKNRQYREEMTGQFTLNYDNVFAEDHHVTGVAGFEFYKENRKGTNVWQTPVENQFVPIITTNENNYVAETARTISTASWIFRLGYAYKEKYIVDFAGRYDASWRFPTGSQWGFFPSVSAAWRINEETFFKEGSISNWMSSLKLRASYGEMGDDMASTFNNLYPDFAFMPGYTFGRPGAIISGDPFGGSDSYYTGTSYNGIPQTNLSWMTSSILNVGIDMGFLNERLRFEFDLFQRKRDGIPAKPDDVTFPQESGMTVLSQNLNSDEVRGFDASIGWTDNIADFRYNVGVNFTLARQRSGKVYGEKFLNAWDEYRWSQSDRWANVKNGAVWMYEVIGVFQTQEQIDNYPVDIDGANNTKLVPGDLIFKDVNGDGIINQFDERPLGYAATDYAWDASNANKQPLMTMGINLGFEWKGIDFAADLAGGFMNTYVADWHVKNGVTLDQTGYVYNSLDVWHHEDIFDPTSPWVPGSFPALRDENPSARWWNDFYTKEINYLRLRNLVVGYTFPQKWTKKAYIEKLRLYFEGSNLLCWDSLEDYGFDPEISSVTGFDYPQHRTCLFGINVTF